MEMIVINGVFVKIGNFVIVDMDIVWRRSVKRVGVCFCVIIGVSKNEENVVNKCKVVRF